MRKFSVALEHPDQPEIVKLIADLDAFQQPLYPPESHHGIDMKALTQPNVIFAVARSAEGKAVGCGAIVFERNNDERGFGEPGNEEQSYGELKRMFVQPENRGEGIAKAVLEFLEAQALQRGFRTMRLETGTLQPEAIGFYKRAGYEERGRFGKYGPDPLSVFMQKSLSANR